MAEIRVPTLGESVTEATIGRWFKKTGDAVAVDEPLVELETDKVTIEVPSPAAGSTSRSPSSSIALPRPAGFSYDTSTSREYTFAFLPETLPKQRQETSAWHRRTSFRH